MELYLPIAQVAINWIILLGLGLAVGFLSGMLGVSGGFVTTPLLIFYGIPSGVAVASQASPIAAASLVGAIRQGGKKSVDYKMGLWSVASPAPVPASTYFAFCKRSVRSILSSRQVTCFCWALSEA